MRVPPERAVPGIPKEPGLGEQPRLIPAVEEEELLREMEELRSENDYLKVGALMGRREAPGGAWLSRPHGVEVPAGPLPR